MIAWPRLTADTGAVVVGKIKAPTDVSQCNRSSSENGKASQIDLNTREWNATTIAFLSAFQQYSLVSSARDAEGETNQFPDDQAVRVVKRYGWGSPSIRPSTIRAPARRWADCVPGQRGAAELPVRA